MPTLTEDHRITGLTLHNLGAIAAERVTGSSVELHRIGEAHSGRGLSARRRFRAQQLRARRARPRNYVLATDLLQQAVSSAEKASDPDLPALATMNVAEALAGTGEMERAEAMARDALKHFASTGNGWRRVECERPLGDLEMQNSNEGAARDW
ncbi:MAG: hypothetical protein ABI446_04205 [Gemmatimonadaceae bacterium]